MRNYSLNAMVGLLGLLNINEYTTIATLKPYYKSSSLENAAAKLIQVGLIEARKGPGGGYILAKPLADIKVKELIPFVKPTQIVLKQALVLLSDLSIEEFLKQQPV